KRSRLYFNSKKYRLSVWKTLKSLSLLCKKRDVKKKFGEASGPFKKDPAPFLVGGIPSSTKENAGMIFTQESGVEIANLDGRMSLRERYKSLIEAKKSILIQMFLFRSDEAGKFFAEILSKKREEGLDVRLNLDGATVNLMDTVNKKTRADLKNQRILFNNLMASGIRVFGFSCKRPLYNELRGTDLVKLIRRNHEKVWLVDAEYSDDARKKSSSVAILGGINIAQEYFGLSWYKRAPYRDQDVAIRGPILKEIKKGFERSFVNKAIRFRTYNDDKYCFNSFDPISEKEEYLKFKREKTRPYIDQKPGEKHWSIEQKRTLRAILEGTGEDNKKFGGLWARKEIKYYPVQGARFVHSRPDENENFVYEAYINLINNAKNEILISNSYFLSPPLLKNALKKAIKRGVKVTLLSNGVAQNNLGPISIMNRYRYIDYFYSLKGGQSVQKQISPYDNITIHEWQGKRKDLNTQEASTLHNKYMIIDEKIALVGSFNLDYSSLKNSESGIIYESTLLAKDLKKFFLRDLKYARKISLDEIIQFNGPRGKDKIIISLLKVIEKYL
ncbi:MAG: phosphatidylserine/phosphatidylglycerophosphate/cardiolipin synthase family protein, partial [Bdellovibrionota bacterium]|nr:phosphatidylserine/phosphatidylglycerophosphate/cardiolipin synthase family protein [Bdellovibrionota bacterium]